MNEEQQLKLQAYLDGELPEAEARAMQSLAARDKEAADLLAELGNTREVTAKFEPEWKVPETREFYWSKIQRAIERLDPEPAPAKLPPGSIYRTLLRFLMPVTLMAVLAVGGWLAFHQTTLTTTAMPVRLQTTLKDAGAFTYCDQAHGLAVVWFSYPAEKGFTEPASGDTVR